MSDEIRRRLSVIRTASDRSCLAVAAHVERIYGERRDATGRVVREMPPWLYGCALAGPPGSAPRALAVLRAHRRHVAAHAFDTVARQAWTVRIATTGKRGGGRG